MIGKPVTLLFPKDRYNEEPAILDRIRRGERVEHYDTIRQRKDGTLIDISLTISPLRDPEGRSSAHPSSPRHHRPQAGGGAAGTPSQRDGPSRQELVCPRQRRGGAERPFRDDQEELSSAVSGRLAALAKAYALTLRPFSEPISDDEFDDAACVDQYDFSPHDGRTDHGRARLSVSGPDIPIAGSRVTSFALLLHEFATNAAKYGALSTGQGAVAIDCSEDDGRSP